MSNEYQFRKDLDRLAHNINSVENTQDKLSNQINDLSNIDSDISTVQKDLSTTQNNVSNAQSNINNLQSDLGTAQTNIFNAQLNISDLINSVGTVDYDSNDNLQNQIAYIVELLENIGYCEIVSTTTERDKLNPLFVHYCYVESENKYYKYTGVEVLGG